MYLKWLVTAVVVAAPAVAQAQSAGEEPPRDSVTNEEESEAIKRKSRAEAMLGAQYFWVEGKAMPGLTLRAGRDWYWLDLEAGFMWSTQRSKEVESSFLGNQLGIYAMAAPLRTRHVELRAGLGGDFYWLWPIHSEKLAAALATKADVHAWLTPRVSVFASARAHLLSSDGVELGTRRDSTKGIPVLFATGVEWKF